jgi:CRP/FNR family transcriptional regulator, anaerobic regulatory protein
LKLKKKQIILKQGQICKYLYFVDKGVFKQYYFLNDKEIIDYFATENKIVSIIGSLFGQKSNTKIIEAFEPSTLLAISYRKLENLFLINPEIERIGRLTATEGRLFKWKKGFILYNFIPPKKDMMTY